MDFHIFEASLAFIQLRKAFIQALIIYYFHSEHHIQIETNLSSYTISEILSQLTSKTNLVVQIMHEPNLDHLLSEIS